MLLIVSFALLSFLIFEAHGLTFFAYRGGNIRSVAGAQIRYFHKSVGVFCVFENARNLISKAESAVFTAKQISFSHFFSTFGTFHNIYLQIYFSAERLLESSASCICFSKVSALTRAMPSASSPSMTNLSPSLSLKTSLAAFGMMI